ncbi:ABC transporter substrate-binding protein [Cohnella xylanilytica]|uniref:ABC transporter substrate-binding protein n=1 Tax=Cohnella xylanilytica TaxID=557555 RepID=UPI001B07482F|nr:ABC transporter substrate-binding protein [Cohnella xylanilytica]GIO16790.1 ABC transporter substrate-binding protein [Cohnella xylanilytica]
MKTKKSPLVLTLMLVLALAVTACGGKADTNNSGASAGESASPSASSSAGASPSASASASEAATKTYKDGLDREVEVPTHPERVVALSNVGELLSLGVKPAGTLNYYLDKYKNGDALSGVASVGDQEADVEKVTAADPDLIIVSSYFKPELIESLQKIAPTVATPWGQPPLTQLNVLAGLLGKETEEKAWIEKYNAKAAEVKEKIRPKVAEGSTAVVLQFWNKAIYQHATNVFQPLFEGVGFVPTEKEKAVEKSAEISEEGVIDYAGDADYLFILVDGQPDKDRYEELKKTAWKNLKAVKNDRVVLVDSARWNDYSTAAMEWILEDLETQFGQ